MESNIEIFQTADHQTQIEVRFEGDTVWLTQPQIVTLFDSSKANISEHIRHIFDSRELDKDSTVRNFRTVQKEGRREVERYRPHYNLDMIISVGYRVNSKRGTQFRQWATLRLKDYLVQGYVINEKRLAEKEQTIELLKTGIRIMSRAIRDKAQDTENGALFLFSKGLGILDDYDHDELDGRGRNRREPVYPATDEYLQLIARMKSDFRSDLFALAKDSGFESAVRQIEQSFDNVELYPTIEEKAATLLYLIVKNHPFVDGNKRIGAACFLYFLDRNNLIFNDRKEPLISNEALASLTLFVAVSKPEEMETVKKLIVSILNRSQNG